MDLGRCSSLVLKRSAGLACEAAGEAAGDAAGYGEQLLGQAWWRRLEGQRRRRRGRWRRADPALPTPTARAVLPSGNRFVRVVCVVAKHEERGGVRVSKARGERGVVHSRNPSKGVVRVRYTGKQIVCVPAHVCVCVLGVRASGMECQCAGAGVLVVSVTA